MSENRTTGQTTRLVERIIEEYALSDFRASSDKAQAMLTDVHTGIDPCGP
jgi:hypothetical protein